MVSGNGVMKEKKISGILHSEYWSWLYLALFALWAAKKCILDNIVFVDAPGWYLQIRKIELPLIFIGLAVLLVRKAVFYGEDCLNCFKTKKNGKALLHETCKNAFFCVGVLFEFFFINDGNAVSLLLAWLCCEITFLRMTKVLFPAQAAGILIWIIFFATGHAKDVIAEFNYATCHSFGTENPNISGLCLTFLFFSMVFLWGKKHKLLLSGTAAVMICLDWFAFGCRTQMIILFVVTVLLWLMPLYEKLGKKMQKAVNTVFFLLPVIFFVVSVVLGIIIDYYGIDKMVSNTNFISRFHEAVLGFREIGLHLWVPDLSGVTRYFYFDNLYIGLIYKNGILSFLWNMTLMLFINRRVLKEKNGLMAIIAAGFYLMFVMEGYRVYSLLLFLAGYLCSKNEPVLQSEKSRT